eukprot:IDg21836t1
MCKRAHGTATESATKAFTLVAALPTALLLRQFDWANRFYGGASGVYVVVDGTDCPVREPQVFDRCMYSHKFKHAGLRYEVASRIWSGMILCTNGPFKCGEVSDLSIFQRGMKSTLLAGESVIADKGYPDARCIKPPGGGHSATRTHK